MNVNNEILRYLMILKDQVSMLNSASLYDINKECENIFCEILNVLFGWNLVNANSILNDYPCIDLFDEENRICVQVTSSNTRKKINDTLECFIEKKLNEKYDRLIILIVQDKLDYKKNFFKYNFFNMKEDIIDINVIYSKTVNSTNKNKVLTILKKYIDGNSHFFDFNHIEKKNEKICSDYIQRTITSKPVDYYFNTYPSIDIVKKIYDEKNIVLLSEAGYGKTELLKKVTNEINNENQNMCAFYKRLLYYTGENIEKLIPVEYKSQNIPITSIVFILDGYDEISDEYKNKFIKKIESFIDQYPEIKILISSRNNFYNVSTNTIPNFHVYYLSGIKEYQLRSLLIEKSIDPNDFLNEARSKKLYYLLESPFFIFPMIQYYKEHYCLSKKNEMIYQIINQSISYNDDKYKTTKDIYSQKDRILHLFRIIGFAMQLLNKNHLTYNELKIIIPNEKDIDLLNYCSIWEKDNNEYKFIHNNFGEWFAAEILKKCSIQQIKIIITYSNNHERIKDWWFNVLSFLFTDYHDDALIKWIIDVEPRCISYIEKGHLSLDKRFQVFKNLFEKYEKRKIWLSYDIRYTNEKFIDFIYCEKVIDYFIDKLKNPSHFTVIGNVYSILHSFPDFMGYEEIIKDNLMLFCMSNNDNTYLKNDALKILGKFNLIDNNELFKIIQFNINNEDSELRTGYYYCLNTIGVTKENIDVALKRIAIFNDYYDDDKILLLDEQIEFNRIFSKIKDKQTMEKIVCIENICQLKKFRFEEIMKNLCLSFKYLYKRKEDIVDILFNLFSICDKNYYHKEMNILISTIQQLHLQVVLFERYIQINDINLQMIYPLVDNECLKFFSMKYKEEYYSDVIAKEILITCYSDYKKK